MELMSTSILKDGKTQHTIKSLFNIGGAVRQVIAISAYIDIATVDAIIAFVEKNCDQRTPPRLLIYTDYSASGYATLPDIAKVLQRSATKIKGFCDEESGIYLVKTGNLFHSKCYLIQNNQQQRLIMGSMNATQCGLTKNEELILSGDSPLTSNSYVNRLAHWVTEEYVPILNKKSDRISQETETYHYPTTMRQLLMDGWLYYELNEQDPFRFSLHLPEIVLARDSNIHPLLSAKITDGISIISLIKGDADVGGLGHQLPERGSLRHKWKRYCVETCYGHWSPMAFDDDLTAVLDARVNDRKPFYDEVRNIIKKDRDQLTERLNSLIFDLNKRINNEYQGNVPWEAFESGYLIASWSEWYDRLIKKLDNEKQFERLISGISWAAVPDVWNDSFAVDDFENSFLDSLKFYWSKSYTKGTSRVVASRISNNLLTDSDIDNDELKKTIEHWCKTHRDQSIFEIGDPPGTD